MTPSTIPMLIDNTGLEANETVRFGVDGRAYEIDLPARRASELRSMADRYIRVARKIPSAPSRAQQPRLRTQSDQEQSRRIRSRARQRGLLTSPRGRISQHVAEDYEATVQVAQVPSQSPGTAESQPAPCGGATLKPSSGRAHAAQDEPAATASMAATEAEVRGGEHGLTVGEKQELRTIAEAAKPRRNIVAGRLRTKGLADRDTAGNWWLTDAGRRELTSA